MSFLSTVIKQHIQRAIEDERRIIRLAALCGDTAEAQRLDKGFRARARLASRETDMSFDEAYQQEVDRWTREVMR